MKRPASWNFKAILLGLAADFFGSQIIGGIAIIPIMAALASSGITESQMEKAIASSPVALSILLIIGLLFNVCGGYVAAHLAGRDEIPHAAACGILSLLIGVVFLVLLKVDVPLWFNLLSFLLIIPTALLGGSLCANRPDRDNAQSGGYPPIPEP